MRFQSEYAVLVNPLLLGCLDPPSLAVREVGHSFSSKARHAALEVLLLNPY